VRLVRSLNEKGIIYELRASDGSSQTCPRKRQQKWACRENRSRQSASHSMPQSFLAIFCRADSADPAEHPWKVLLRFEAGGHRNVQDTRLGRAQHLLRALYPRKPTLAGLPEPNFGNIVPSVFTPVLAKHSKSFSLIDCISVGVDRMQRNFEPMRKQVEAWQRSELTDVTAKVVIYEAFVEGKLEAPKHLARNVHDLYFEPRYEEFRSRTIWSLSNAFTSAFKELDPIPQFKATAKLGEFLEARLSQSF